jgi:site-specific DNA-methyltransferase (cytosine-N4-specific)
MTSRIFWRDTRAALHLGDALAVLATLPDQSADCIVTSPPYWAKRDYGMPGQYGLESSPAAYVDTLRSVFREARRVLADDGTCWLNLGDCYSEGRTIPAGLQGYPGHGLIRGRNAAAKNLLGLPWRVAFALQDDGWILRNAIVWHKPNAMPQSVRDRMSNRYELIFLLAKSRHYWFDLDPIRVPHARHSAVGKHMVGSDISGTSRPGGRPATGRHPGHGKPGGTHPGSGRPGGTRPGNRRLKYGAHTRQVIGAHRYPDGRCHPNGRNPGDVWAIPTRPFRGAHFAAFPVDLPARCIKAGCKPDGTVLDMFCGAGTTGVAAVRLGRHFIGIELNPAFAALAAERLRHADQPNTGNGGDR